MTLFCDAVDFTLRPAKDQMPVFFGYTKLFAKFCQMNFGLILNLILHRREVHGYIAAVGGTQGLDDVDNVYCAGRVADDLFHPLCKQSGFFRKVGSENDG